MSLIGNILWIVFGGGLAIALEYLLGGVALCLTIVGIPFGLQCFKLTSLSLLPFGRTFRHSSPASGCLSVLMNIIWIVIAGFWIALTHLGFAIVCAVTIVGIPFALQHLKLARLAFAPFGKQID